MFAVMGVTSLLLLPADPRLKILGINNRLFLAVLNSLLAVGVECWLNAIGALTWEYHYWNSGFPYLIFLIGYLPFFLVSYWVHDLPTTRPQLKVVAVLGRSEEHTSELQSLMRISYAVFCSTKKQT